SARGNVMVSLPCGLALPKSRSARTLPSSSPGYQASSTAGTLDSHGMSTGPPVFRTTTVWALAAATAETSEFCPLGRDRLDRSLPSLSLLPTMTIATSDDRARFAAAVVSLPSLNVTLTPLGTWLLMPLTGLTVYSGVTAELPLPPVCAAPAYGPMTAIECSEEAFNGSCPPEFFKRTAPCSASDRATAPSGLAGIGLGCGGLSKSPSLNI